MIKKLLPLLLFLSLALTAYPSEVIVSFDEENISVLNEELRQINFTVDKIETDSILWESDGGDTEMKTADDMDMQQKQIKRMVIENRTRDPSSPVTGEMWFRTDI